MTIQAHEVEIELGDQIAWNEDGPRKEIAARKVLRDCGCVHVYDYGRRVTFPAMYRVEIAR